MGIIITRTGKLNEDRREQGVAGVGHTQSGIFHPFEYGRSRGRGESILIILVIKSI